MQIFKKITSILCELSGLETICLEHKLQDDLALDSLQMITLLMMLEENFQIFFEESDMNPYDLISVEDVVRLVGKYSGGDTDEDKEKD